MQNKRAIDYYHFGDVVRNISSVAQEIAVVIEVQKQNGDSGKLLVVYQGQQQARLASPYEFEIISKSPLADREHDAA